MRGHDGPDPRFRIGIRDRAMLHLAFAAGLRVSALVGLRGLSSSHSLQSAFAGSVGASEFFRSGRSRQKRCGPGSPCAAMRHAHSCFSRPDGALSRDGFEHFLAKHVATAPLYTPSIATKRVSPHVLRQSCAMSTLEATHDIRKVALWLGHASVQTTEIYVRADPTAKLEAIDAVLPPGLRRGRFRAPDKVACCAASAPEKRMRSLSSALAA